MHKCNSIIELNPDIFNDPEVQNTLGEIWERVQEIARYLIDRMIDKGVRSLLPKKLPSYSDSLTRRDYQDISNFQGVVLETIVDVASTFGTTQSSETVEDQFHALLHRYTGLLNTHSEEVYEYILNNLYPQDMLDQLGSVLPEIQHACKGTDYSFSATAHNSILCQIQKGKSDRKRVIELYSDATFMYRLLEKSKSATDLERNAAQAEANHTQGLLGFNPKSETYSRLASTSAEILEQEIEHHRSMRVGGEQFFELLRRGHFLDLSLTQEDTVTNIRFRLERKTIDT